jgi:hypothetical protein
MTSIEPSFLRRLRRALVPILVCGPLAVAGVALGHITNVVGMVVYFANPPPSVLPGGPPMGPNIHAFDELQDIVLPVPLPVDARPVPGQVKEIKAPGDLNPGVIPAGTCVSSHYFHLDTVNLNTATGGAAFDGPILGIALLPAALNATNVLGWPWTAYPPNAAGGTCVNGAAQCGLELTAQDVLRFGQNMIEMSFETLDPGDRIRVITRGCCEKKCSQPPPG